jgi:hypothetical protein
MARSLSDGDETRIGHSPGWLLILPSRCCVERGPENISRLARFGPTTG